MVMLWCVSWWGWTPLREEGRTSFMFLVSNKGRSKKIPTTSTTQTTAMCQQWNDGSLIWWLPLFHFLDMENTAFLLNGWCPVTRDFNQRIKGTTLFLISWHTQNEQRRKLIHPRSPVSLANNFPHGCHADWYNPAKTYAVGKTIPCH